CDDRRFSSVTGCVAAVYDVDPLIAGDNPADYCLMPVIIRGNQSSPAIVQLQGRIQQRVGNAMLRQLRTNGSNNYSLCLAPLNDEAANHDILAGLHKGARGDVTELRYHSRRLRAVSPAGVQEKSAITMCSTPDDHFTAGPH